MSLMGGVRAGRKTFMELMIVMGKTGTADMPLMSGGLAASVRGSRRKRRLGDRQKAFLSLKYAM